ncbi:Peptidoglycan-associated lipoprotein [Burkholderiales bacterium]|nr:Peptidoglycan-associated lipoprotein [Burkholderiales bacterium]
MHKIVIAAALVAFLAGCQSTPADQSPAPVEDRAAATGAAPGSSGASTSGAGTSGVAGASQGPRADTGAGMAGNPLRDPSNILSRRSVYFDFDSFTVKDEFRPLIEAHGRYLAANRGMRMVIQGNTDERGSREYNIALGQKRADAVKRMMTLLGAQESQIETVSFGKEKPKNTGHGEAAWAENRRDDIVYTGE